jgi:hypothetical protein
MPDQAPWQQYQQPAAKPWEQYAAPAAKPWEKFQDQPVVRQSDAPEPVLPVTSENWRGTPQRIAEWWKSQPSWAEQYHQQTLRDEQSLKEDPSGRSMLKRLATEPNLLEGFSGSGLIKESKLPIAPAVTEVKKLLSPQSVSPIAGEAAGSIRAAGGQAARDTASTAAALEEYRPTINAMPDADRLAFINYVEGDKTVPPHPAVAPLADTLKAEFQKRRAKIEAMPGHDQMTFVEDYYPHHWQDPKAAQAVVNEFQGGGSKQGSGASLKKRTVPTIADGIAAGLRPLTTDPIEATMRYVASMDKFIASQGVLDAAKANGTVKYIRPKVMGASGNPDSFKVPKGWAPLQGRGATDATGAKAYAPEDWARVYNNYISRGFHDVSEDVGKAADAFQRASNSITGLELGLSGYHAFNIATSAVASDVARAVSNFAGGRPLKGFTALGRSLTAPVTSYLRGKKAEQVYLGRSPGTPDLRKVIDIATEGGIRGKGKGHAGDYGFSNMGSYLTAWKRGSLKKEMAESLQNIKDRPVVGSMKEVGRLVGRTMETVSRKLFEDYIPRVKNAAVYDLLHDWIEANPTASHADQVRMARTISDAMDDRFGEMIQDNIFVNKMFKQVAQIVMRSYSWTLGLARQVGKAAGDPRRLSIKHPDYNPSAAGIIGTAIAVPTINAIYQYLKTGQAPEDIKDLIAPRTGGQVPGFGGRSEVEERAMLPSHERDIFGWFFDPKREAANKQSRMLQMAEEGISGTDWAGRPYMDPDAEFEQQLGQWLYHVGQGLIPMSLQQLGTGQKTGSELGMGSSLLGIREASKPLEDPEGTERGLHRIQSQSYKRGQKSIRRQQSQYGGPAEHE